MHYARRSPHGPALGWPDTQSHLKWCRQGIWRREEGNYGGSVNTFHLTLYYKLNSPIKQPGLAIPGQVGLTAPHEQGLG